jgi:hypothetical protein
MTGGTYACALEVGFNEKQAAFFSHLAMDTRNEIVCQIVEELEEAAALAREAEKRSQRLFWAFLISAFVIGVFVGIAV